MDPAGHRPLVEVGERPRLPGLALQLGALEGAQYHHLGRGPGVLDEPGRVQAVEHRHAQVDDDDVVDQAYLAGQPSFSARYTLPDELVPIALDACDQLEGMLDEIDRWAEAESVQLLEAPDDIKRYRKAYLDQVRVQLKAADGG